MNVNNIFKLASLLLAYSMSVAGARDVAADSKNSTAWDVHPIFPSAGRLLDSVAKLPTAGDRRWQFSSFSRESRIDETSGKHLDWGWNTDYWNRRNPNVLEDLGDGRYLLADVSGPGLLSWIWVAVAAQPASRLTYPVHVYLDDMESPSFSGTWLEMLDGTIPALRHSGLAYAEEKTYDSFVPIPFQSRLRVVAERPDNAEFDIPSFYILGGMQYAAAQMPDLKDEAYQRRLATLSKGLENQQGRETFSPERVSGRHALRFVLSPGAEQVILDESSPGAILALKVRFHGPLDWKENAHLLRGVILEAKWDGEEESAIWSPLDSFFGMSPGLHPFESYPFAVNEEGEMVCYFPMPYQKGALLKLTNIGREKVELSTEVVTGRMPERAGSELGYFHARWHKTEAPEVPQDRWMDKPILHAQGRGRLVGVHLHVWNPLGGWWGEGDEKIFVDGERFPSIFGTGTEDFLGFCYGYPKYKTKPFHNVNFNQYDTKGHQSLNRYMILDSVPFQSSIAFYIERYNEIQFGRMPRDWVDARERTVKMVAVPYWYSEHPFNASMYRDYSFGELTDWYELEPKRFESGAVEIEDLPVSVSGGKLRKHFWSWMEWSGDTQLVWEGAKPGDVLRVPVRIDTDHAGHQLHLRLNRHHTYGSFRVRFAGQEQDVDLNWTEGREWSPFDLFLDLTNLPPGSHDLEIEAIRPAPRISDIRGALDFYRVIQQKEMGIDGLTTSGPVADQVLGFAELCERMVNLRGLAVVPQPGESSGQFSSYNRMSRYDKDSGRYVDWHYNHDGHGVLRRDGDQMVLAEMEGPGCIYRIWSAGPQNGNIRIYIDGKETPVFQRPFIDFFNGAMFPENFDALSYVVTPTIREGMPQAGGNNFFAPIGFQKSIKIVADPGFGVHYIINWVRFPEKTVVESFQGHYSDEQIAILRSVNRDLLRDWTQDFSAASLPQAVPPGEHQVVFEASGSGAVTGLQVELTEGLSLFDSVKLLRSVVLECRWDGLEYPAVTVPLGEFFGTGPRPERLSNVHDRRPRPSFIRKVVHAFCKGGGSPVDQ